MNKRSVSPLGKNLQPVSEAGNEATKTLSVSLVTQGKTHFYVLTMPIKILAECATVETRDQNPVGGFQRKLDERRAEQIAKYVDDGNSIPNSIVLSAQPEAALSYTSRNRSITFRLTPRSFYILDGQHRVFGFTKAKTQTLRVPVVIYSGLSAAEECRLFIDINTTQRPVPNALLLDIKRLANRDTDAESLLRDLFDRFADDPASPLFGLMSPAESRKGSLNRVTFNAAVGAAISAFPEDADADAVYRPMAAYLMAWKEIFRKTGSSDLLSNPTWFRALFLLFPEVGIRAGNKYSIENLESAMSPLNSAAVLKRLAKKHVRKHQELHGALRDELTKAFKVEI